MNPPPDVPSQGPARDPGQGAPARASGQKAGQGAEHEGPPERREAVALAYRQTDAAPRVVAKGRGLLAEEIIEKAREHGVYVHESPELLTLLMQVDLDEHIPSQLYLAVAELLAWLYRLEHGEGG